MSGRDSTLDASAPIAEPEQATDRIFATPVQRTTDFTFDQRTASVFDDMVSR